MVNENILDFIRENPNLSTRSLCKIFNYSYEYMRKVRMRALADTRVDDTKEETLNIDDPMHDIARQFIEGMNPEQRQQFERWVGRRMEEKTEQMELKINNT